MFGLGGGQVVAVGNPYQPSRIAKRERAQQQRIDHTEDRGTGADAEAGDENRKRRKSGIAPHAAKRVAQILRQVARPARDPGGAGLLPIFVSYCQTFCEPRRGLRARTRLARPTPESWTRYGIPSLPTAGAAFRGDLAQYRRRRRKRFQCEPGRMHFSVTQANPMMRATAPVTWR